MNPWLWFYYYINPIILIAACLQMIYRRKRGLAVLAFVVLAIHIWGTRQHDPGMTYASAVIAATLIPVALLLWGREADKVRW
jgi:hypothetical protein